METLTPQETNIIETALLVAQEMIEANTVSGVTLIDMVHERFPALTRRDVLHAFRKQRELVKAEKNSRGEDT